jgi:hypothetical protein
LLTKTPDKNLLHKLSDQSQLIIVTPDLGSTSYYFDSPLIKDSQGKNALAYQVLFFHKVLNDIN